jgi:hypothetical protein
MEIEHGGTAVSAVTLDMNEDGVFLPALGQPGKPGSPRDLTVTLRDLFANVP